MQQYEFIEVSYHNRKNNVFIFEVTDGLTSHFVERSIEVPSDSEAISVFLVLLNEFGKEGWSLVDLHNYHRAILQRLIQQPSQDN